MALTTLTPSELLSAVATDYLADSFIKEAPLLGLVASNATNQAQRNIEWGAKVVKATSGGRALTDNLTDDTPGSIVGASMSIPDYYVKHQFSVIKADMVNAMSTGKITAVRNPIRTAIEDAFDSLVRKAQSALYIGAGSLNDTNLGVIGLNTIIGQTGNYAGISRTTYPRWKSIVNNGAVPGTPEALTVERVTKTLRDRRKAGVSYRQNNGTKLIFLSNDEIERDVIRKLYSSIVDEQALQEQLSKDVAPYVTYSIGGIPVVSDTDCPDNTIYLLNLNKLMVYGFDDRAANVGNRRISYVPLRNDKVDTTINVRIADVSDEHPDLYKLELSTRFQLVAMDPIDSVSAIKDVSHTL